MHWTEYALTMLAFSLVSMLVLYVMMRLQALLPFNPQGLAAVPPDLAFNTAASFTTNTNWQSYVGETTMSYLTQMAGLAYHNFVSAATGIALAIAFIRGIAANKREALGNFWVDMTRAALWVLLPFCDRRRAAARLAGRGPEPEALRSRPAGRSPDGDDRPAPTARRPPRRSPSR